MSKNISDLTKYKRTLKPMAKECLKSYNIHAREELNQYMSKECLQPYNIQEVNQTNVQRIS